MAKFTLRYNIIATHDMVVEADNLEDAKQMVYYGIEPSDVIDDVDSIDDILYDGVVECSTIFDENGDAHYF